jgi:O-antigen ligase
VQMIPRYPLGLGVQYAQLSKRLHEPDGRSVPAHNILLQSALSGGWLLLITIIVLLFLVSKTSLTQKNSHTPLVFSLWIGVLLVSFFNDFLFSLPLLWIAAGIILSENLYPHQESLIPLRHEDQK